MLRTVTAKKIDWFVNDLEEGTRAVAAAITTSDLGYKDLRNILAAINEALNEVGMVYDALKSQAGNVRGLVAASQSETFDDALAKVVTIATRLDLLRACVAEELGVPGEEIPGKEGDVSGAAIATEISGEIPSGVPQPVPSDQPTIEASEDEEDFEGKDMEEGDEMPEDEDEDMEYGEDEEEKDIDFADEGGEEAPPEEELPREAQSSRKQVRNSITAKRSAKASSGVDYLKNLFNFIGR